MSRILLVLLTLSTFHTPIAAFAADNSEKKIDDGKLTPETYEMLNLFGDVFERVREQYVEQVPDKKLIENAINGMLSALDPHSGYLDADNFEDMKVQTKGEFGGLGIEVTMENGLVKVVSPIDETPAAKAGIKSGDLIIKINEEEVMGLSLSDAVDKMRGKVGTSVTLTLARKETADPIVVKLERAIIKIKSVRDKMVGDDVGYIRITSFNEQVEQNLERAIKKIKAEHGAKLKGLVLDMRNNPGGLLDQAIFVSDIFLDKGEIVSTRGRRPEETKRINATPGDILDGLPIVVLINEGSASASEIVAGALQDHRRAIVMGTKSFGKGSVQTIVSLPGQNAAMRLTTARYYTPSGRSIQAEGIVPDVEVKPAKIESITTTYQGPSEASLHGSLKNENNKVENQTITTTVTKKTDDKTKDDESADDYQLQRAADLIRGVSLFTPKIETKAEIKTESKVEAKTETKK
jgi:carboxyl-terminal processing protease